MKNLDRFQNTCRKILNYLILQIKMEFRLILGSFLPLVNADCSPSLELKNAAAGGLANVYLSYDNGQGSIPMTTSWTSFFQDSTGGSCPPTSCKFKTNSNCGGDDTQTSGVLTMAASDPWGITVDTSVEYTSTLYFCIVCLNSDITSSLSNQRIKITNLNTYCSSKLTQRSQHNDQEISYRDDDTAWTRLGSKDDFFSDSSDEYCKISGCTLYEQDCVTVFANPQNVEIDTTSWVSFYRIFGKRRVPMGYDYNVCYKCHTQSGYTINNSYTWRIWNVGICITSLNSPDSNQDVTMDYAKSVSSQSITIRSGFSSWDSHFNNDETTDCPITSCSLLASDCATPFSTNVVMAGSSPWGITMDRTVMAGYEHTLCVSCTNGAGTKTDNNWKVKLNPLDCSDTLTDVSGTPTSGLTYTEGAAGQVITPVGGFSSWDTYFSNSKVSDCPITSCKLTNKDACSTNIYAGSSDVTLSSLDVTASKTNIAGYSHQTCIVCSNYGDSAQLNGWTISQTSRCYNTISSASTPSSLTLAYDLSSQNINPGLTWDVFFSNTLTSYCPITSCSLYNGGSCGSVANSNSQISIGSSSPFNLVVDRSSAAGYVHSICIRCINADDSVDLDGWSITQTAKCQSQTFGTSTATNVVMSFNSAAASQTVTPSGGFSTWDAFFVNSDTTYCKITSCQYYASGGCGVTATDTSRISIGSSSPFAITALNNVNAGYSQTICIRCTNGYRNADLDGWTIAQSANPCLTSLSTASATESTVTFTYSAADELVTPSSSFVSWDLFFSNSVGCSITSCSLYDAGSCGSGSFSYSSDITLSGLNVYASKTTHPKTGFSYSICVRCTNGVQNIDMDNWVITRKPVSCIGTLSLRVVVNPTLKFYRNGLPSTIQWDQYILTTDSLYCQVHTCTLSSAGNCGGATLVSPYLSFDGTTLTAVTNIEEGYIISICLRCTNGNSVEGSSSIDMDNFKITQNSTLCGTENIELASEGKYLISESSLNSGIKTIYFSQYSSLVQSTIADECPITNYTLVWSNYTAYTDADISFDNSLNILIDTSSTIRHNLLILFSNPTSLTSASLPFYVTVANFPPFFTFRPPRPILLNPLEDYTLPDFTDHETPDNITVIFSNLTDFMVQEGSTIKFMQNATMGNYTVFVQLMDQQGKNSTKYPIFMQINEKVEQKREKEEVVREVMKGQEEQWEMTAKVVSMSERGRLVVQFSHQMELNLTQINQKILDMYIVTNNDRDTWFDDFNVSLNFTWTAVSFNGNQITFDLTFNSPSEISPYNEFDTLLWHVKDSVFFQSQNQSLVTRTLVVKVPKQVTDREDHVPMLRDLLFAVIIIAGVMAMAFSGGMMPIAGLVNGMQLIAHLPIFDVQVPQNSMKFINNLMPVVFLDVLQYIRKDDTHSKNYRRLLNEDQNISDQIMMLTYDTHIPTQMLRTMGVLIIIWFVRVLIYYVIGYIIVRTGRGQKLYSRLEKTLFYNDLLYIIIEGYLTFVIAFALKFESTSSLNFWQFVCTWSAAIVTYIVVPGKLIYTLTLTSIEEIVDQTFQQKWGALFWNLKIRNKFDASFYLVFIIRRVFYVLIAFTNANYSQFQIILLICLNFLVSIYQASNMPLCSKQQNWIELWNEFWIQMATYNLMLFTDLVVTQENMYTFGWTFITIMIIQILPNFFAIVFFIANVLKLFLIKYFYNKWYLKVFLPFFQPKWQLFRSKYGNFQFLKDKSQAFIAWLDKTKKAVFDWTYLKYPFFTQWIEMHWPRFYAWFSDNRYATKKPQVEFIKFYKVEEENKDDLQSSDGSLEVQYMYYSEEDASSECSCEDCQSSQESETGSESKGEGHGDECQCSDCLEKIATVSIEKPKSAAYKLDFNTSFLDEKKKSKKKKKVAPKKVVPEAAKKSQAPTIKDDARIQKKQTLDNSQIEKKQTAQQQTNTSKIEEVKSGVKRKKKLKEKDSPYDLKTKMGPLHQTSYFEPLDGFDHEEKKINLRRINSFSLGKQKKKKSVKNIVKNPKNLTPLDISVIPEVETIPVSPANMKQVESDSELKEDKPVNIIHSRRVGISIIEQRKSSLEQEIDQVMKNL